MMNFWNRLKARLVPFRDPTVWVLLLVSLVPLVFVDPPMVKTLIQWSAFGLALAAMAVLISRIIFSSIDLTEHVYQALKGNTAAGLVVLSIAVWLSFLFLGLVIWAKA